MDRTSGGNSSNTSARYKGKSVVDNSLSILSRNMPIGNPEKALRSIPPYLSRVVEQAYEKTELLSTAEDQEEFLGNCLKNIIDLEEEAKQSRSSIEASLRRHSTNVTRPDRPTNRLEATAKHPNLHLNPRLGTSEINLFVNIGYQHLERRIWYFLTQNTFGWADSEILPEISIGRRNYRGEWYAIGRQDTYGGATEDVYVIMATDNNVRIVRCAYNRLMNHKNKLIRALNKGDSPILDYRRGQKA
ncbi:uncharacterized protein F4822DRAFT_434651 [Hypoxylon trugodes]|uniref:uncharacterized protein n=1 Tax=Hypoxylon trugodes TaxID=326681 RepID=UPI00219EFB47|nr:uncharacterized protein F4822DRAFT_434651 [Hypoxylon trugodes]KAI1383539.1 hypothetical protein F4822DRAFT_434651 [Hypoxylon trugodes]